MAGGSTLKAVPYMHSTGGCSQHQRWQRTIYRFHSLRKLFWFTNWSVFNYSTECIGSSAKGADFFPQQTFQRIQYLIARNFSVQKTQTEYLNSVENCSLWIYIFHSTSWMQLTNHTKFTRECISSWLQCPNFSEFTTLDNFNWFLQIWTTPLTHMLTPCLPECLP